MSRIELTLSEGDDDGDALVAYLRLPDHPGPGVTGAATRTKRLRNLLKYEGPDIHLDFDADGRLIGIEILG
jgi:hypothetical protein